MPEAAPAPLLEVRDVSLSYGGRLVLDRVRLAVAPGQVVTVIGPNGAGKTTLVRLALGLIRPDRGSIWRRPKLRLGYMPQRLPVDETVPLSVRRFLQLAGSVTSAQAQATIAEVGIAHLLDQQLHGLSGGETQRVLLGRALLRRPDLLVLDEPAQGVDVSGQSHLYAMIRGICESHGCGVLMVSHDLHLVMAATEEVICLNTHVCCSGTPHAVSRHPEYVALFGRGEELEELAIYHHHHDHHHDMAGQVVDPASDSVSGDDPR